MNCRELREFLMTLPDDAEVIIEVEMREFLSYRSPDVLTYQGGKVIMAVDVKDPTP